MEIELDLQRVLWHEFGHLCVDLVDTEINPNFSISAFRVRYHDIAISNKWGGGVTIIPSLPFDVLVEDKNKTSFAILNLISGCLFQTVFLKKILGYEASFENCFCLAENCAGQSDCYSFHKVASLMRNKYGRSDDFINFTEKEIFDIYYNLIIANKVFMQRIYELAVYYKDKIFESFKQSQNKKEFHYNFSAEELETLKNEVHKIMSETSFTDLVKNLKERIFEKMPV